MPGKVGSPPSPVTTPSTPAAAPKPAAASTPAPAAKGFVPAGAAVTTRGTGLDAPKNLDAARRAAALTGGAPAAPVTGQQPVPPAGATLSVAFDNIKAPGGPTQARILDDGLDAWNARMDIIENAKTSIDSSYFIVEKDPFGYAFLGGLLKKQLQGVPVRVSVDAMADTFGTHGFKAPLKGQDYLQELVDHGAKAYIYHPVYERPLDALKGDYSVLASNHDKILVADGKVGVTGGRNIAQDYYANPKDLKGAWRDMDVLLQGEATAGGLKQAFEAELTNGNASKPVTKDLLGNWDKKDIQLLGAYEMMNTWLKAPPFTDAQKTALRADKGAQAKLAQDLVQQSLAQVQADLPADQRRAPSQKDLDFLTEQATALVTHLEARGSRAHFDAGASTTHQTEAKIIDQTSAAAGQRVNGIAPALAQLIDGAKKSITIENPYVVLTQDMLGALEKASARGVKIDIITNSPLSTDSDVTQAFFLDDWKMILAKCPTANIYVATGDRKFHTKSAVIDDDETVISTYNMDLLSGYVNGEVGAVVKSPELAADLKKAFEHDRADPNNGFIQYTIQRDADGNAVLKDGQPITVFGPENHLPPDLLAKYQKKETLWGHVVRNYLPQFKPLRHDQG